MESEVFFSVDKFISSTKASKLSGYTGDYISRLCRLDKINCKRVGKAWYVEEKTFSDFLLDADRAKKQRKELLTEERKAEYQEHAQLQSEPSDTTTTVTRPSAHTLRLEPHQNKENYKSSLRSYTPVRQSHLEKSIRTQKPIEIELDYNDNHKNNRTGTRPTSVFVFSVIATILVAVVFLGIESSPIEIQYGVFVRDVKNRLIAQEDQQATVAAATDTSAPSIRIVGSEQIELYAGTPYYDAGVIIADEDSSNISYLRFVDGMQVDSVRIDTKILGAHTILYVATDKAGNRAEAARTIIVLETR